MAEPVSQVTDLSVAAANGTMTIVEDTASTTGRDPVKISPLANDTGDHLQLDSFMTEPDGDASHHGYITVKGSTVIYTPEAGFEGTDTFRYSVHRQRRRHPVRHHLRRRDGQSAGEPRRWRRRPAPTRSRSATPRRPSSTCSPTTTAAMAASCWSPGLTSRAWNGGPEGQRAASITPTAAIPGTTSSSTRSSMGRPEQRRRRST